MWRLMMVLAALAACGDNKHAQVPDDAPVSPDAPGDATPGRLTGCLDRPGTLPAAPASGLPCELVPPGVTL